MKFQDKLKKNTREQLWSEYCGFLDLRLSDYMFIQRRLMEEQLKIWRDSGLGKELLHGKYPETVEEFRKMLPLTTYADYADILLSRRSAMLPGQPTVWIETTWEGGLRPVKVAPYTREMLDTYRHNIICVMMVTTAKGKGDFCVAKGDRVLYGGAPLPYATGLMPSLLAEEIQMEWLPDPNEKSGLSFSQRIKKGFKMAMKGGIDYFFGIGSVANYITENFASATGKKSTEKVKVSPSIAMRYLRAKYISRRDRRTITPGDIFRPKAFISAGTDAQCYRDKLAKAWGMEPFELAAGTESTCIGTETWEHNGMVFFPDACFYEFIPEDEMQRNLENPNYEPRTCLMDEVRTGGLYELVISVLKGGAFARYRIGDVYRCVCSGTDGGLPRFTFADRVSSVIDIAGFTRLTESTIGEVVSLSKLGIRDWLAKKEFSHEGLPFLHMYIELSPESVANDAVSKSVLTEHLSVYFKYFDSDYNDLKRLLNMEPLTITILKYGAITAYKRRTGRPLARINPSALDVSALLKLQESEPCAPDGEVKAV